MYILHTYIHTYVGSTPCSLTATIPFVRRKHTESSDSKTCSCKFEKINTTVVATLLYHDASHFSYVNHFGKRFGVRFYLGNHSVSFFFGKVSLNRRKNFQLLSVID